MKFLFLGMIVLIASVSVGQQADSPLIGTWQFISQEARDDRGQVSYPYGSNPGGRLTYDAAGNMSVLLFDPALPKFASGDRLRGTTEEIKAAFEGSAAYYGTYTIDRSGGSVTHHVLGSTFPNYIGTNQLRYYKVEERRLYLTTPPYVLGQRTVTTVNVFERMN
jgi:hypothetical protein